MSEIHTCSVEGCFGSSKLNPGLAFFRYPTELLRYQTWIDFSNNPSLMACPEKPIHAYICAAHFDESQFQTPLRNKLVHRAVPSIPALGLHPLPSSQSCPIPVPLPATGALDPSLPSVSAAGLPEVPPFSRDYLPLSPVRESDSSSVCATPSYPLFDHIYCKPSFSGDLSLVSSPPSHQPNMSTPRSSKHFDTQSPLHEPTFSFTNTPSPVVSVFEPSTSVSDDVMSTPLLCKSCVTPCSPTKSRKSLPAQINATRYKHLTPKKVKLLKSLKEKEQILKRITKEYRNSKLMMEEIENSTPARLVESLASHMSLSSATFLAAQIRCSNRKSRGLRWSMEHKFMALSLYKRSPKCYTLLGSIFSLPNKHTLIRMVHSIPLGPGINHRIFHSLSQSLNHLYESDRICALMFDEMSIRPHLQFDMKSDQILGYEDMGASARSNRPANHALVFMVEGLQKKWKQPIAHYFPHGRTGSDKLAQILREVIKACLGVGLRIVVTICDMGANNVHALKLLGATKTNPYFELEGQRIITLYDPPHLLKWTRNMLYKHDVELPVLVDVLQGKPGTASWKDIREAHSLDSKNPLYCSLHKLGDDHLDPQYGAAMKVSTAAQVLSHTMASLISGYVASGTMPNTALGTARFAGLMDELFDSFNGTSLTPGGALGLKCQLRKEREALHLKFWNQALKDVDSLKFQRKQLNPSTTLHPEKFLTTVFRPPSQDGWIITIRAAKLLWKTLKDAGLTFLETRRLNQDAIEHLFDSICAHCGSNNNPTVQQFEAALKTCIVNGLAFRDLQGGNCEEDKDPASLLSTLQEFVRLVGDNTGTTLHVPSGRQSTVLIKTDIEKFHPLVGFESFSVAYVSGYIARRLLSGDTCKNCISSLVCSDPAELHYAGIYFKEYSEKLRGLTYPSAHLLKAVADGARILEDTLDSVAHLVGVKQRVASAIRKSVSFDWLGESCLEHQVPKSEGIVEHICRILIPWWCRKKNSELAGTVKSKSLRNNKTLTHK